MSQQIVAQPIVHSLLVHNERGDVVVQAHTQAVSILQVGVEGPPGPPGIDASFVHNQIAASATWSIHHGLNKFPSVTVVDSGDNVVYGDTQYLDQNNVILTFSASFSGKAYFN